MIVRALLCLSIIAAGLALRGFGLGLGLSAFTVKYGGSILWGAMVFFLVAIVASRSTRRSVVMIAAVIAVGVELFRLVHSPWLDSFRLTMAGALLLGRIFSPWDILAYAIGIALGALLDNLVLAMVRIARPHSAS
jgi:Protein of unknown function (DUF2809)